MDYYTPAKKFMEIFLKRFKEEKSVETKSLFPEMVEEGVGDLRP